MGGPVKRRTRTCRIRSLFWGGGLVFRLDHCLSGEGCRTNGKTDRVAGGEGGRSYVNVERYRFSALFGGKAPSSRLVDSPVRVERVDSRCCRHHWPCWGAIWSGGTGTTLIRNVHAGEPGEHGG